MNPNLREAEQQKQLAEKEAAFLDLILRAYRAEKTDGFKTFHGKKAGRLVSVGPVNCPVTRLFVEEVISGMPPEAHHPRGHPWLRVRDGPVPQRAGRSAKSKGIDIAPKYIPAEVFDKRAVEKNQVVFHDVASIEVKPHVKKNSVAVELTDFSVFYSQDSIAEAERSLKEKAQQDRRRERARSSRSSKDKNGVVTRERLTKKWTDWIDYWAVDFNFESKREIIRKPIAPEGSVCPASRELRGGLDRRLHLRERVAGVPHEEGPLAGTDQRLPRMPAGPAQDRRQGGGHLRQRHDDDRRSHCGRKK